MNNNKIEDFKEIGIKNPNISFIEQVNKTTSANLQFIAQFDKAILNQVSWLFYLIFKIYIFWINSFVYKKILNKQITSRTKQWHMALSEARNYGAIILNKEDRDWIDQEASRYALTGSQRFLLVWTGCIKYRKRIFYLNGLHTKIDLLFLFFFSITLCLLFTVQTIYLIAVVIIPITSKAPLAIGFILAYFYIIKFIFFMIKAQVWDSNKLFNTLLCAHP